MSRDRMKDANVVLAGKLEVAEIQLKHHRRTVVSLSDQVRIWKGAAVSLGKERDALRSALAEIKEYTDQCLGGGKHHALEHIASLAASAEEGE